MPKVKTTVGQVNERSPVYRPDGAEEPTLPTFAEDGEDLTVIRCTLALTPLQRLRNAQRTAKSVQRLRNAARRV